MACFNGLYCVHLELTSRCNKDCWMCGRRKIDREYPEIAMNYGDMQFELVEKIATQFPEGIVVQFHNNGEPLLYPRLKEALQLFEKQIRCFDTNAKLIVEKADEIIGTVDTVTISVIENDSEADRQFELVKQFLAIKGERKPRLIFRCLGDVDTQRWKELKGVIAARVLHNPLGSFKYKKSPTVLNTEYVQRYDVGYWKKKINSNHDAQCDEHDAGQAGGPFSRFSVGGGHD